MNELALRLPALRRFAIAISVLNLLGHTVLGFEQSWAYPLVALSVAYTVELVLEVICSRALGKRPRFLASPIAFIDFLLPAHITGLACSMLLYANDRVEVVAFATIVAICSKTIFRVTVEGGTRHVLNPSNTGIAVTLLLFPWVGIAPPYQFTEGLSGWADWALPGLIICSGAFLNTKFTKRHPLILTWLSAFALQAVLRSLIFGTPLFAGFAPMTGLAFLLFTFYMATDPATTPSSARGQIAFGLALAAVYALLQVVHVVFGLFFALFLVCVGRGVLLALPVRSRATAPARELPLSDRVARRGLNRA